MMRSPMDGEGRSGRSVFGGSGTWEHIHWIIAFAPYQRIDGSASTSCVPRPVAMKHSGVARASRPWGFHNHGWESAATVRIEAERRNVARASRPWGFHSTKGRGWLSDALCAKVTNSDVGRVYSLLSITPVLVRSMRTCFLCIWRSADPCRRRGSGPASVPHAPWWWSGRCIAPTYRLLRQA